MSRLSKAVAGVVGAAAIFVSASASANFISYWVDPDGGGAASAVRVGEFLDFTGAVYAENTYTGATTFDLQQSAYAEITGRDSVFYAPFANAGLVATLEGGGTGDLSTGLTSFTDGLVQIFSGGLDPLSRTLVASFDIFGGGAVISPVSGAPNGASTVNAVATFFAPGFFFFDNGGVLGADLATADLTNDFLFGFVTSNLSLTVDASAITAQRDSLLLAGFTGLSAGNVADGTGRFTNLYSGANGQFRLTEVPEPGSLALLGLGLLGLGAFRRRASRRDAV